MSEPSHPAKGPPERFTPAALADIEPLDRDSDVPLYFQLAAALKVVLEVEGWEAGTRFASERELEEAFDVSRAVIRPALELLEGDGAIVRVKGSGAYVAPPRREVRVAGLVGLSLDGDDDLSITVLSTRKRRPDRTVSHYLEIEDRQTQVVHVTAVVDAGRPSVCLVDSFSSGAHVPWLLPTARALKAGTKPPKPSGVDLTRSTVLVEHTFFGEWGSSQVAATAGDPAIMGRFVQFGRTAGSKRERPLEFARLIYRADSAQLPFEVNRSRRVLDEDPP